jgi:hypothetical protein
MLIERLLALASFMVRFMHTELVQRVFSGTLDVHIALVSGTLFN